MNFYVHLRFLYFFRYSWFSEFWNFFNTSFNITALSWLIGAFESEAFVSSSGFLAAGLSVFICTFSSFFIYIITPSLKMDMSLYPFCSFFVCLPEAISINNLNISSVIFSKSLLLINSPALKSIQLLFLFTMLAVFKHICNYGFSALLNTAEQLFFKLVNRYRLTLETFNESVKLFQ